MRPHVWTCLAALLVYCATAVAGSGLVLCVHEGPGTHDPHDDAAHVLVFCDDVCEAPAAQVGPTVSCSHPCEDVVFNRNVAPMSQTGGVKSPLSQASPSQAMRWRVPPPFAIRPPSRPFVLPPPRDLSPVTTTVLTI